MRWSIIRLIFFRELRDQLRDRRTLFMIAVLPLVLYPILGTAVVQFAAGSGEKPSTLGIVGSSYLPHPTPATPAKALEPPYPPLLVDGRFPDEDFDSPRETRELRVELLDSPDRAPLDARQVDLMLIVPSDFRSQLEKGQRPELRLLYRQGDEQSRLAARRLYSVLSRWKQQLRGVRFQRRGLPADYADPFRIDDPELARPAADLAAESLIELLVRLFPFLLVMWSLAGALYPAVDLCAGEKERGTMETLLISPASREEIVLGKFLTIWVFSAATALLNLASMGLTASGLSGLLAHDVLQPLAIVWCIILALPLAAFFSAICLAVGAYARSSKEGQYYLMPLFLLTMPLVFLTLAPGVELNPFYSLVPVTGVALLMQRLMTVPLDKVPWLYFVPVLLPIALYSWLALRWAVAQFKREEVLFREAERLDIGLWLRRLFREKEALPSLGQAFFCFALLLAFRWLSLGVGRTESVVVRSGVAYLAFVAAPPLFMALLLTTRPRQGLALQLPSLRILLVAILLAALLLPPLAEVTYTILYQFPHLMQLLSERQPLVGELLDPRSGPGSSWWQYLLVYSILAALCEELAFRGFILSGLRRRLGPWSAILLSSLLFALYHMNVFQVVPTFLLGLVLGLLTTRSGSILPAMVFHLLYNGLLIGVALLPRFGYTDEAVPFQPFFHPAVAVTFTLLAFLLLMRVRAYFELI
jgi:sodium transport system permease protein